MSESKTNILNADNLKIYLAACEVPKEAQKPIQAGRLKGMTDINAMWRIKKVTELFGTCGIGWKVEIADETITEFEETKERLVKVVMNLRFWNNDCWSEPIPGVGTAKIVASEKNGKYLDDNAFKKARTDAFGACCKWLGIGGSVYWQNDPGENKYEDAVYVNATPMATKEDIISLVNDAKVLGFTEANVAMFFGVQKIEQIKTTKDGITSCREAMKQSR